jgi:S-formylglutathione hydrolase FrmB
VKHALRLLGLTVALCGCQAAAPPPPAAEPQARVVAQEAVDERTDKLTIESLATDARRSVWVLKPAAWTKGSTGWRALYLLHGCCAGGGWDWLDTGEVAQLTAALDAVVIVPEGGPMGWYTNWLNGPDWETFHMTEVRTLVEPRYGVGTRRSIAGMSMGGYGAYMYAARHPGVFEAAAALSGVLDIRLDARGYQSFFRSNGENTDDVWGPPSDWPAHNPADQVEHLKGLRLYASTGNGTPGPADETPATYDPVEASIHRQNTSFAEAAGKAGLNLTKDFYGPGTHTWPYWVKSLERALPILLP